jgi:hypothetical protein
MAAKLTLALNLNQRTVGWFGLIRNRLTLRREAALVGACLAGECLRGPVTASAKDLPYASPALTTRLSFAGLKAIAVPQGTPPGEIKGSLMQLAGRNLARTLRTTPIHIADLQEACGPDATLDQQLKAVGLLRQIYKRQLFLTECIANLSTENQTSLSHLIRGARAEIFRGDERSNFATFFALHADISLEDKASLIHFTHPNYREILAHDILTHWRDISAQTVCFIMDALAEEEIRSPEIGLGCARVHSVGAGDVAYLIDKYLPKSIAARTRKSFEEISPAKYSESDHRRAAEIINSHLLRKRPIILAELADLNNDLSEAVDPFVVKLEA